MLRKLTRMPAEMSSESRRQLLNAVTDLFLLDEEPSDLSKAHYGEIAMQSLSNLESADRQDYAGRVAAAPGLPRDLAVTLANDSDSEVARLVLRLSPVLSDADLAAIAVSQSQQHLVAIAERDRLPDALTDILVQRGDRDVLQTVSANEGAAFSEGGFDRLLQRGGDDPDIAGALSRRTDLTPKRAQRVLRIVMQLSGGGDAAATDAGRSLARQARKQRFEVRQLIADLAASRRELDDVVTMLAEEDRAFHLAEVFAQAAGISTEQALRVLMQREVSGVAVACRALDLGPDAFRALLSLRGRRLYFSSSDLEDALADYRRLDAATAERTMRFLKLKTSIG
jgi:hypothetical protein